MGNDEKEKEDVEPHKSRDEHELNYKHKNLTLLPSRLFQDKKIEKLNLSTNNLQSQQFSKISSVDVSMLKILDLSKNKIQTLEFLQNLELPHLTHLDLSNNKLTEFNDITHITPLTKLNLSNNQIISVPISIKNLTNLKSLDVANNNLTSINELIELKSTIRELNVFKNDLLHDIPIELKSEKIYFDTDLPDEIIPGLFLGSIDSASNTNLLKNLKVHAVLSVCGEIPDRILKEIQMNFNSRLVDVDDNGVDDLEFESCFEFIEQSLEDKVLVHCWQGISRSSSVVIYFIMRKCNMSFNEAYMLVKSKRPIINPNFGFIQTLLKFTN